MSCSYLNLIRSFTRTEESALVHYQQDGHTTNKQTNSRKARIPRSLLHHGDPTCAGLKHPKCFTSLCVKEMFKPSTVTHRFSLPCGREEGLIDTEKTPIQPDPGKAGEPIQAL